MHPQKQVHDTANLSDTEREQERAKQFVAIHAHLHPLLTNLQGLNASADQVRANWMARGWVQDLEVIPPKMVLRFRPSKPISEGLYQYWTSNPVLQSQLFAAYLCDCAVDIFSKTPEGVLSTTAKDGGEILTIQVEQRNSPPL